MIQVIGPGYKTPEGLVINTTSRSDTWSKSLSPFFCGSVNLNHKALDLTFDQVIDDPNRKMGHAFVIAMLLEGAL